MNSNRTTSHARILILLFLACIVNFSTLLPLAHAQDTNIVTAKQHIIEATIAVRNAEQQGVSNSDLLPLTRQLNIALQYEETANSYMNQGNVSASNMYALESIALSIQVSSRAQQLTNNAHTTTMLESLLAYAFAIGLALVCTILLAVLFRVRRQWHNRTLLRSKYG